MKSLQSLGSGPEVLLYSLAMMFPFPHVHSRTTAIRLMCYVVRYSTWLLMYVSSKNAGG